MKFLTTSTEYDKSNMLAPKNAHFNDPLIFHSFWKGALNEKVVLCIKSFWYFHQSTNYTRILWTRNWIPTEFDEQIMSFCEIRELDVDLPEDSTMKLHIIYNYGGCWFEPSMFCLRSLGPLFFSYTQFIMTYQSGSELSTNTNIIVSCTPRDERLKTMIDNGLNASNPICRNTFDDLIVLPCSWFDGVSLESKYMSKDQPFEMFKKRTNDTKPIDFSTWYKGSFSMCLHTEWDTFIESNSVIDQLSHLLV
jgi:hypothetical protein